MRGSRRSIKVITDLVQEDLFGIISFYYSENKFYSDPSFTILIPIKSCTSFYRRLLHTIDWCKTHHRNYTFEQILFPQMESTKAHIRKVELKHLEGGNYCITCHPIVNFENALFAGNFESKIMDSMSDVVLVTEAEPIDEPAPRIVYANEAFSKVTGYKISEIIGKSPRVLQGQDTSKVDTDFIRSNLKEWKSFRKTILNYKKDGTPFIVELNISPVKDETGWWTHWVSIQRNISEEIKNDRNEVRIKRFFERVQTLGNIGCFEVNLQNSESFFSSEIYKIYAVRSFDTERIVIGETCFKENEIPRLNKLIQACILKGNSFTGEFEFIDFQGNEKWIRMNCVCFTDANDNPEILTGTMQDITKLHDVSQKVADNEIETEVILKTSGVALWSLDIEKNELSWDSSMYELYDIDPDDFSGDYEAWASILHPEDKDMSEKAYLDAVSGVGEFNIEFRIFTRKQEVRYIRARAEVLRNHEGSPYKMLGVNLDITKDKEIERKQKEQNKLVEHQSKLATIGELASGVGHEINNPLTVAFGYLDLLSQIKDPSELELKKEKYFEKIYVSLERIEKIVSGLRSFSRVNAEEEVFELSDALQENITLVNEIFKSDGIKINYSSNLSSETYIYGCRGKFQQVVMNLLNNAKDAFCEQIDKEVYVDISSHNDEISIKIKDNGPGVPQKIQDKIFESFFTTKEVGKGTGLGLYLSHRMIQEMRDQLTLLDSRKGNTTFEIKIPEYKGSLGLNETNNSEDLIKFESEYNIIVIDDSVDVGEILCGVLEDMGAKSTFFESSIKALEHLKLNPIQYDLILSDIQMKEMDGVQLLQKVKANDVLKAIPFVFVTGGVNYNFENSNTALSRKIAGYIFKPFSKNLIYEAVKNALNFEEKSAI